ncbi:MAG: c-type cytochrome [Steroidobacteraceae bacterium]|nr:c-type cytochrome [Steroidobacteraceae bacterium]
MQAAEVTREQLVAANYRQGMVAFQQRCSACHSLADGGKDLAGPNLYGMFSRAAGSKPGFRFSAAMQSAGFTWTAQRLIELVAAPDGYPPGSSMALPEPVPEADRIALASFLMVETGGADWPRPAPPAAARGAAGPDAPLAERFPSFWNHLMRNTTRYRLEREGAEPYRFDVYFRTDGSAAASDPAIKGFWHVDETDTFCYALHGLPVEPTQFVECFPVVAMSIPRFREELWTSTPVPGVRLTGGIVAGRPAAAEAKGGAPAPR